MELVSMLPGHALALITSVCPVSLLNSFSYFLGRGSSLHAHMCVWVCGVSWSECRCESECGITSEDQAE